MEHDWDKMGQNMVEWHIQPNNLEIVSQTPTVIHVIHKNIEKVKPCENIDAVLFGIFYDCCYKKDINGYEPD